MLPEDVPGTRRIVLPHDIISPGAELTPAGLLRPVREPEVAPGDELAARRRRAAAAGGAPADREAVNYKLGGLR
jgi:hypothetical protein